MPRNGKRFFHSAQTDRYADACTVGRDERHGRGERGAEQSEGMKVEGVEAYERAEGEGGWNYQLDTYLSPLAYHGWQIGIGNEWWQPF